MHLTPLLRRPLQMGRDAMAELLRRMPITSEVIGPPKDEDQSFEKFLARGSYASKGAAQQIVFPSERVSLPAARGVFGPTDPDFPHARTYDSETAVIYDCPEARVFHRPHAIIGPDDRLFTFASNWHSSNPRSHFAFHQLRLGKIRRLRGRSLYFGGNSNIWHLYIDNLRQLALLEQAGRSLADFDHIIAKRPTTPVEARLYAGLPIPEDKLVSPESSEVLKCDQLTFFATPCPNHGRWQPPAVRQLIYRALCLSDEIRGARRLYVSRSAAKSRRVMNESDIVRLLRAHDFEVLQLEAMSPESQIRAFQEASIIVGAHGAGLTNILFSRPGTALIEMRNLAFRPENGVSECYRTLAGLGGLDYYTVTTLDAEDPNDPHNSNLRFGVRDLEDALSLALKQSVA